MFSLILKNGQYVQFVNKNTSICGERAICVAYEGAKYISYVVIDSGGLANFIYYAKLIMKTFNQ